MAGCYHSVAKWLRHQHELAVFAAGPAAHILATPAFVVVFAFLGAFFPDSEFIVGNMMRVGMFFTPVFWVYSGQGGVQKYAYHWNPFTYFLESVREPITAGTFPMHSLAVTGYFCLGLWALALLLLGLYRKRIVFLI